MSLAHGWASGPTSWLSEHVLGVQVAEPGGKTLRIRPNLGDLTFVEGTFPTPLGVVKLHHTRLPDGSVKSDVEAPSGIRLVH
jgi:alpha-L-rhamnosidase